MITIGIFIKDFDERVSNLTKALIRKINKKKYRVLLTKDHARKLGFNPLAASTIGEFNNAVFLLSIGGDGTMLRSAGLFSKYGIPILGINLGRRGFLTETEIHNVIKLLPKLAGGDYRTDERMMLDVTVKRGSRTINNTCVLNDIVIGKNGIARIIRLKAFVNEKQMTTYAGDGLIISTPTGSTGHNLSADGPIIDSKLSAFVLTGICPLSISNRSVILGGDEELRMVVTEVPRGIQVILTTDGQHMMPLKLNDEIQIKKASYVTRFIRLKDYNFFSVLKDKLGWEG